jgi:hypothetical protein
MPIVGGLDIHRKQITFDYLDTVTGEVKRGQVAPADRLPCEPGLPGSWRAVGRRGVLALGVVDARRARGGGQGTDGPDRAHYRGLLDDRQPGWLGQD